MMTPIVIAGDELKFSPLFGERVVTIAGPARIQGKGQATIQGKRVCVGGDEAAVVLTATYTTPVYTIPGTGTVTISALAADQRVPACTSGGVPIIVQGARYQALFTPSSPAIKPGIPPTPDPSPAPTSGTGEFIVQQTFVKAGRN